MFAAQLNTEDELFQLERVYEENPFHTLDKDISDYAEMLYGNDVMGKFKGSIVICKKLWSNEKNNYILRHVKWLNVKSHVDLADELKKVKNQSDVYININPMKNFKREKENIHQLKFLYMDLDVEASRSKGKLDLTINQVYGEVVQLAKDNKIPYPTMIIHSGRGLHIYWGIGDYTPISKIQTFWYDIQKLLEKQLIDYGVDKTISSDTARVLRVPGTINSKNNKECHVLEYNPRCIYSLQDIRDKYFKSQLDKALIEKKEKIEKSNKCRIKKKSNVTDLSKVKNTFTLHQKRLNDLMSLIKMREGNMQGTRNIAILQASYWYTLTHKRASVEEVIEFALIVNKKFTEVLSKQEVIQTVNSALKYATRKIDHDRNLIEDKKVSRNVCLYRDSVINNDLAIGLNYKTETLIDVYSISKLEMENLEVIIDYAEKNRRDKQRKKKGRRSGDINGLTKREKKKKDTYNSIQELKAQGLKQSEVANQLGLGIATIKRRWKSDINI